MSEAIPEKATERAPGSQGFVRDDIAFRAMQRLFSEDSFSKPSSARESSGGPHSVEAEHVRGMIKKLSQNTCDAEAFRTLHSCLTDPVFLLQPEAPSLIREMAALPGPGAPWLLGGCPVYLFEQSLSTQLHHENVLPWNEFTTRPKDPTPDFLAHGLTIPETSRRIAAHTEAEKQENNPDDLQYPQLRPGISLAHLGNLEKVGNLEALHPRKHRHFFEAVERAVFYLRFLKNRQALESLGGNEKTSTMNLSRVPQKSFPSAATYGPFGMGGTSFRGANLDNNNILYCSFPLPSDSESCTQFPFGLARYFCVLKNKGMHVGTKSGLIVMRKDTNSRFGSTHVDIGDNVEVQHEIHILPATADTAGYFTLEELRDAYDAAPDLWKNPPAQRDILEFARMIHQNFGPDKSNPPVQGA